MTDRPNTTARPRITLADIARSAHVSVSTVSLALRESPLIPVQTRFRIQRTASRLGYVRDPHLAQLMGYLRQPSAAKHAGTLAYVTAFDPPNAWRSVPVWQRYYSGAKKRGGELGYNLEEFSIGRSRMLPKRLGRVLQTRGIRGVIVAPLPEGTHHLELEWDRFCTVAIGLSLWEPRQHSVVHHHLASMVMALQKVRELGYRRIAMVLERNHDARVQHHWSAAFLAEQRRVGLPADLIFDQLDQPAEFVSWFRRCRPDVIVGDNLVAARMLDAAGHRIPYDCGFVVLNLSATDEGFAGVNQLSESIGASAVSRLIGGLRQNQFGIPSLAETTLVPGIWVDAASLPPKGSASLWVRPKLPETQTHPHLSQLR